MKSQGIRHIAFIKEKSTRKVTIIQYLFKKVNDSYVEI